MLKTVALFGGTFDPIHNGHINSALELSQRLPLDELRLIPCHLPPHRERPGGSSGQRLKMVELALEGLVCEHSLTLDDRELKRDGPSYSIDTIEQIRAELGAEVSLSWVMGTDAFNGFDRWQRWQDWLDVAHIIVMARPGHQLPTEGAVAELLANYRAEPEALAAWSTGSIVLTTLTEYPISATQIRAAIASGEPLNNLLPANVVNYIQRQGLYAMPSTK